MANSDPEKLARDADYLIESFIPVSDAQSAPPPYSTIPLPFCTPQIKASFDSPFARGYNPVLATSAGISQEQLLAFIDGLNLAMTSSPPLRVVNVVGNLIGFVPSHWAAIAGAVIQTAAQTGMHVLSKTITDRYLRAANLRLFNPRGLSVRICSTTAMQHFVMRTGDGAEPSRLDMIGRGVGTLFLHLSMPLSSRIVRSIADKPPRVSASISEVGDGRRLPLSTQRRLASLEGHALPLDLDVPPPAKAQGFMDAMNAWAVAHDARRTEKEEDRVEARRRELERINSVLRMQRGGYASPSPSSPPQSQVGRPSGYGFRDEFSPAPPPPQMGGYPGQMGGPSYGLPMGGRMDPYVGYAPPAPPPLPPRPQMGQPFGYGYGSGYPPPPQIGGYPGQMGSPSYGYGYQPQMGGRVDPHMQPDLVGRQERKAQRKTARREAKALREVEKREAKALRKAEKMKGKDVGKAERRALRKAEKQEQKDLREAEKLERERQRGHDGPLSALIGPKETKLERRVANADLLERWATDKVLWLVIMSAELDREIEGIQRAEGMEDEEHVDAKTWRAEITRERDALEEEEDAESDLHLDSDLDSDSDSDGHHVGKRFGRSKGN